MRSMPAPAYMLLATAPETALRRAPATCKQRDEVLEWGLYFTAFSGVVNAVFLVLVHTLFPHAFAFERDAVTRPTVVAIAANLVVALLLSFFGRRTPETARGRNLLVWLAYLYAAAPALAIFGRLLLVGSDDALLGVYFACVVLPVSAGFLAMLAIGALAFYDLNPP